MTTHLCAIARLVLLITAVAAGPAQAATGPQTATVTIENFTFAPAEITVPAGTSVSWLNHDDIPHTVTSDERAFKSPPLDTDDGFTTTFEKPGTYRYFCALHPHMTGTVVVTPLAQ